MSISSVNNKKRSKFNLSHSYKLSCDMGKLVPVLCEDVTPGDTFKVHTDALVRFAPMLAPLMHEVDVYVHYFFVPDRLVHEDFESFITGGERGDDITIPPYVVSPATTGFELGSLADYVGLPIGVPDLKVSASPFRVYNLIFNEFYRQQDLQDLVDISLASGEDTTTSLELLTRNWNKDYFTSALPRQQKGQPVALPIAGNAAVSGIGFTLGDESPLQTNVPVFDSEVGSTVYPKSGYPHISGFAGSHMYFRGSQFADVYGANKPDIYTDLTNVTSATINDLRAAFQLQRHLERNMRSGARLTEFIKANFGVHNKDYRLQRPEYLGGGRSPVVFSEVLQTAPTSYGGAESSTPLASMSGHGFSSFRKGGFVKSFTEHGWIMGLMSVMPKSSYNGYGLDRRFSKQTRFDYIIPDFVHLGEEPVTNKEIYAQSDGDGSVNDDVFGWQPRYQWSRKRLSRVAGEFQTDLAYWHLARQFTDLPLLNNSFLQCVPRADIYAETESTQKLRVYLYNKVHVVRMLPKFGTPGYIDH